MHGWNGKILRIDLDAGVSTVLRPDPEIYHRFLGGKGLAGYFLGQGPALDWDHPDTPLLFFAGPLVATISPTSGRSCIMSRSPLTGAVADTSVGGRLGTELKRAGWDGVIITGRNPGPCGIEIRDSEAVITDASDLAGARVETTMERFQGQGGLAAIGPAAENGVLFASVCVDKHHAAGRCGLGLSFAAKNIKYLLIKGTGRVPVHDLASLKTAREDIFRLTAASPVLMGQHGFTCLGTGTLYDLINNRHMMPTDNFRATRFAGAKELNATAYARKYQPRRHGCKGCHILCKKVGPRGNAMPEFETMSHFTALLGNVDMDLVIQANDLCNSLGMDTISAASTLACHTEVTGRALGPERILSLLEDMASGRGAGRELALGAGRYAREHGKPGAAMAVKNLELPAYDPRGAYGMALAYAVATRGGCHLRAYPVSHEILRKPVATDRFSFSGKARIIKIAEDMNAVVDSLTACKFCFFAATLEEFSRAFTAVTGLESTAQDLLARGERIYYNERILNARYGFTSQDDDLPERFFTEPGSSGQGVEIPPLDREEFLRTRAKYYAIRGLDEHGLPRPDIARKLGLDPSMKDGEET